MSEKELAFVCSEIGTRDYAPKDIMDKQFSNVSDWLWKKYDNQIVNFLKQDLRGLEDSLKRKDRDRAPLRFDYTDPAGKQVPIDHTEDVKNIAQINSQVFWHPQVVGGQTFRQFFGNHAMEIITNPRYRNWRLIVDEKPGYGMMAVGPDRDGIVRTWKIYPSPDYPSTPPTVTSEPPYTRDICWSYGILHYTSYSQKGGSPWTELAKGSTNPLHALMIELLQKYKLSV